MPLSLDLNGNRARFNQAEMPELNCQRCGKVFRVKPAWVNAKYCSVNCYRSSLPQKVEKICVHCGSHFSVRASSAHLKCCSNECRRAHWVGERAAGWKGGICFPRNPKKYAVVHCGGKQKSEHVVLAELALGRPLPPGAEVHHFDCNRQNNSPFNLVICENQKYHALLEARGRRLHELGSLDLKRCWRCREVKPLDNFNRDSRLWDGRQAACRSCGNAARSEYYYRKLVPNTDLPPASPS